MKTKDLVISSLCAALMAIFSQLSFPLPFSPVPITLQIFGVVLISSIVTKKQAITSIIVYLLLGAIGIPVFANFSGGFSKIIGPTGGYLIGFVVMTLIISYTRDSKKALFIFSTYLAVILDYVFGVGQLMIVTGSSITASLIAGLYPFIIKDVVVTLCAILISFSVRPVLIRQNIVRPSKIENVKCRM